MQADEKPGDLCSTVPHLHSKMTELKGLNSIHVKTPGKDGRGHAKPCDFLFKTAQSYKYILGI